MKILLLGGSGTLGKELQILSNEFICPPHHELNIQDSEQVYDGINYYKPDIVIHAAAIIDNRSVEQNPIKAIATNIVGTSNVAIHCSTFNVRLVYISTDYVYSGTKGNYFETDEILPTNRYAWTKLGGECAVRCVKNHLIIRTSFGSSKFPYLSAYENQFVSKDYVDVIAPKILKASKSDVTGIINIGSRRKSMYEYAKERNPFVLKSSTEYKDFSLNTFKYNEIE